MSWNCPKTDKPCWQNCRGFECRDRDDDRVTCGGGPPGDPNGEQAAARILELEQNEARLETFIMQQDMRVGDLQKAVQRLKDLNNELFVSRCQAHMRTEQLEDFLRRMLEAATPQIGHAWKAEIRLALVEAEPDSKTPNAASNGPAKGADEHPGAR